jgi:hypothetical protein
MEAIVVISCPSSRLKVAGRQPLAPRLHEALASDAASILDDVVDVGVLGTGFSASRKTRRQLNINSRWVCQALPTSAGMVLLSNPSRVIVAFEAIGL